MQVITSLYTKYLNSTGITTDTRNIQPGNIFFALKGDNFNANAFAAEALQKGASFVVVDEVHNDNWVQQFGDKLIVVESVLKTLQQLAGQHRSQFNCPVLALTGSNGKTTTKELIAAVLSKKYKTYATKGNLNNHIGIPLTLLSINKDDCQFAVIEMGANHQKEIESYCEYVNPDYGMITNVGLAHIEGFGGFEGVVKGKTELYKNIAITGGKLFVSIDNEILMEKAIGVKEIITYGKSGAYCTGDIEGGGEFLKVIVHDTQDDIHISTNLVGNYNFENALAAVCIGKYFGVEIQDIKQALENYVPSNNRSQKVEWGTNTIILDAYNANPSSMTEALKNFAAINAENKIAILGEMMELGEYAPKEHEKIYAQATALHLNLTIFVGNGFKNIVQHTNSIRWFEDVGALKEWFNRQAFNNATMLIKGSRKNQLEKIL
jgi:UDP-N-acetylmuramoyl-tripeptide--D-alanyl-D-alanine ligase